jgi:hypothetical protein
MTGARAEFRVFGHGIIDLVQNNFWNGSTVLQQRRLMPAETYLLSRHPGAANVKIRDRVLDVKVRVADTPEGYQIFRPAAKEAFPLTPAALAAVGEALGVRWPGEAAGIPVSESHFLDLARAHAGLTLVEVTKERFGFTLNGAICEYARVYFNGALLESACVESEDAHAVTAAVEALGLTAWPNTNYLDAAARVVGLRRT